MTIAEQNDLLYQRILSDEPIDQLLQSLKPFGYWCIKTFVKYSFYEDLEVAMQSDLWICVKQIKTGVIAHYRQPYPYIQRYVQGHAKRIYTQNTKTSLFSRHKREPDFDLTMTSYAIDIERDLDTEIIQRLQQTIEECRFTDRELLILQKRADGVSYREIGEQLDVTTARIGMIWSVMCQKLRNKLLPIESIRILILPRDHLLKPDKRKKMCWSENGELNTPS